MELIGKKVTHKKYGTGTVIEQDSVHLIVMFASENDPKKFAYPKCFETFLKLLDADEDEQSDTKTGKQEERSERYPVKDNSQNGKRILQKNEFHQDSTLQSCRFFSVEKFCSDFKTEIDKEISHIKRTGGKKQRIFDGRCVEEKNGKYVYTFEADEELNYPEGTQIILWYMGESSYGTIIGCEEFTVIFSTGTNLGKDVFSIEFSAEPWRLLESLKERLDDLSQEHSDIVKSLVCDGQKAIEPGNHSVKIGQETAVQMSKDRPITFVWGPPGTGKTETLAKIAWEHILQGNRVLMLSYSNVSVDGAIMRVHNMNKNAPRGTLVRYGYARRKELRDHGYLTSYNLAIHNHKNLLEERRELINEKKSVSRKSDRFVEIDRRLAQIKNKLIEEEKQYVMSAMFVATTVSKAVVDKTIRKVKFDVVIFDEASMAYIPQIVFAASLAKSHFICMGDFRQLPPIVQSDRKSLLNTDVFRYCGITSAVDEGINHKWLCMLDTQYRMHPDIAEFASKIMYGQLLSSADGMREKRKDIIAKSPIAGHAVAFADLSGMMSVCVKNSDFSHVNVLSAMISFALALEAAKSQEVGIITPYKAQSKLLHAMAKDAANANPKLKQIACATVHQFQGSERDVIIYDAVDCYRMSHPGMMLTLADNQYANRLFNVALTRAKGKFIGVANIDYMDKKQLSGKLMFQNMIKEQRRKESCVTGKEILDIGSKLNDCLMTFFSSGSDSQNRMFLDDIKYAKKIYIDIPDKPSDDDFLKKLVSELRKVRKEREVKLYFRAEKKQNIPSYLRNMTIENSYIANPIAIIDEKIVWFGMPSSEADFKADNQRILTKYRPIIRFAGENTAKKLYGFLEMKKRIDQYHCETDQSDEKERKVRNDTFANYVFENVKCPTCGKPMKLRKNKNGKFLIGCTGYPECDKIIKVDKDLVEKYFRGCGKYGKLCPYCKKSLEAKKSAYGLYIQCCGYPPHKFKPDEV